MFYAVSLTKRALIALGAGLLIGIGVSASADSRLLSAVSFVQPIGALWVNAIRMTVVPLVFSLLVVCVASATDAAVALDSAAWITQMSCNRCPHVYQSG